ncbi:MAG: histidine kinase, partial [Gammaproteobacteria bacterium]|nr:histidine kinase [Gammaproteobacteria bacterium]
AVSISDRDKILAFVGIGSDHHLPGTPISSSYTREAIDEAKIIYANGYDITYSCSLNDNCRLGSVLVIPVLDGHEQVLGTIKLYEPKQKLFSTFNTLNTINAVIRRDPDQARALIQHLSQFFRRNLSQQSDIITLEEELEHINDYLKIELARFGDRLTVDIDINPGLLSLKLPPFSLQPLIENAIKHGTSSLLACGNVTISSITHPDHIELVVSDNAGNYRGSSEATGLGLKIVDKRLKNMFGQQYGLLMSCQPQQWTKATITMPHPTATSDNKGE